MLKTGLMVAALLAAGSATAQEAAAPQEVEAAFTWTGVDTSTMPMGEGQEAFLTESFLVSAVGGGGPLAGLGGRCLFTGVTDLTTLGLRYTGNCVYQDAEGNQLWEQVEGASEGNGTPTTGTGTWTGGTGQFEDASGEFTWDSIFAASPRAGVYQGTGTKTGTLILAGR